MNEIFVSFDHHCTWFRFLSDVISCLSAFRAQQGDVLRYATRIVPVEAFQTAAEWLRYQITSPIDPGDTTCKCLDLSLTKYQRNVNSLLIRARP